MEYSIYHVTQEAWHGMAFRSYDEIIKTLGKISKDAYECVYTFKSKEELSLDDIYYIFNMKFPRGYHAHSMSVSDVVETPDGFYFCDSFGWKKLDWEA